MANREKNGKQKNGKHFKIQKNGKKKTARFEIWKKTAKQKNGKKLIRPKVQKKRQKNYHCPLVSTFLIPKDILFRCGGIILQVIHYGVLIWSFSFKPMNLSSYPWQFSKMSTYPWQLPELNLEKFVETKTLPVKILRKNARKTTSNPWEISKSNRHRLLFFFREKKYCPVKSFFQGYVFPWL